MVDAQMAGLLRLPLGPQTSEQDAADEVQVAHAKEHKEEEAHLASRLAVGHLRGAAVRGAHFGALPGVKAITRTLDPAS